MAEITSVYVGGLALIVGISALAQRLAGWENKPLMVLAAALFVAWTSLVFPPSVAIAFGWAVWSILLWCLFLWLKGRLRTGLIPGLPANVRISAATSDPVFEEIKAFVVGRENEHWARKIVLEVKNKSLLQAQVFAPIWKAKLTPEDPEPYSMLIKDFDPVWTGSLALTVAPGETVAMWVALSQSESTKAIEHRIHTRENGTILLPVKQSGKLFIKTFDI